MQEASSRSDDPARALHPFAEDPWRRGIAGNWAVAIIVAIVVAIGVIALVAAT